MQNMGLVGVWRVFLPCLKRGHNGIVETGEHGIGKTLLCKTWIGKILFLQNRNFAEATKQQKPQTWN
jgi:hypothetical protein